MEPHAKDNTTGSGVRWLAVVTTMTGLAMILVLHWQVFFWVNTEATMGVIQRIFYIHVPAAWVAFFAFGIVISGDRTVDFRIDRLETLVVEHARLPSGEPRRRASSTSAPLCLRQHALPDSGE